MKKVIFTLFVSFAFLANVSAQLKVNATGNVGIGGEPDASALRVYSATYPVFYLEGANSKLQISSSTCNGCFASYAQAGDIVYRPLSVPLMPLTRHGLIFSIPNNDNDGRSYFKFGDEANGGWFSILNNRTAVIDGNVGIGKVPASNAKLDVAGNIYSNGLLLTSDERLKTDIKPLSDEKDKIYVLQGRSYRKMPLPTGITDVRYKEDTGEEYVVPEKKAAVALPEYGYLAQELKEIFPDLVSQDSEGYYSVNYIGLIPVIVEALKDQRIEIETQREQIKQLVKLLEIKSIDGKMFAESGITDLPVLLQNTPNPFNVQTEIGYYIPASVGNANIYIYDIYGYLQRSITISERGSGAVILQASALGAGIYVYTLICDGKPVDTKQMILTK